MSPRRQDRTGQAFGKLAVIADGGGELRCRCQCGREGLYPRAITKPTYRGPLQCPWCCGSPGEECGTVIPFYGRVRAATCSDKCRKARACRIEKERYRRVKDTPEWKATRVAYLERLALRIAEDPELAARLTEANRQKVRRWRARQNATLEGRRRYREMQRRHNATQARRLANDPAAYAAKIEKQRAWYRSLSEADYQRIFVEPRRVKAKNNS